MAIPYLQSKNSFEAQQESEKTILIIRRHWFVPVSLLIVFLFFAFVPFLIYFFLSEFDWFLEFSFIFWFFVVVFFLFWWVALFKKVMMYVLTCVVLTNKRLIRITTKGIFKYEREEIPLSNIQDVTVKISGFFGSLFDFGDIEVQSAGATVGFYLTKLPHPQKIKEKVLEVVGRGSGF